MLRPTWTSDAGGQILQCHGEHLRRCRSGRAGLGERRGRTKRRSRNQTQADILNCQITLGSRRSYRLYPVSHVGLGLSSDPTFWDEEVVCKCVLAGKIAIPL